MLAEQGEDKIFKRYLEAKHGVLDMLQHFYETEMGDDYPHRQLVDPRPFYNWLDLEEGRRARWAEVKRMKGDLTAERALEIAMDAKPLNVQVARLQHHALNTRAIQLNSDLNPAKQNQTTVNVQNTQVNIGAEWLEALLATEPSVSLENPVKPENRVSTENAVEGEDYETVDSDPEP